MPRKIIHSLTTIKADHMLSAIQEFNRRGRIGILEEYGFGRSSKFYLMHDERIYDTKVLVAAAYHDATGKKLSNYDFAGGVETYSVFRRLKSESEFFARSEWFKDTLGELRNLAGEFDRLPDAGSSMQTLGFSNWISRERLSELHTKDLPGIYVIAAVRTQPARMKIVDSRVVYIGETVEQTLYRRLSQLIRSLIAGKPAHGGGERLRKKGFHRQTLWLSIRSFPRGYDLPDDAADSLRAAQIRLLERTLLYEFVLQNQCYPAGNVK